MASPDPPRGRALWKRGLDLAALGMTMLAGSLLARRTPEGEKATVPGAPRSAREQALVAAARHGGPAGRELARQAFIGSGRGLPGTPPSTRADRLGYEDDPMSARDMTLVLVGLAVFAIVSGGAAMGMTALFHGWNSLTPSFTPQQTARIVPPGPHLQTHPHAELREERARELQLLHAYAWLNAEHSRARIPIGRAVALTVGKSLDAGP